MTCTCHKPLRSWMVTAWEMRSVVPLHKGIRAGIRLWAKNRKDRHS